MVNSIPAATAAPLGGQPTMSALGGMGSEAFLNLLVTQLRYQNPMAPSDPSAMLQQTAMFTQVETLQQMSGLQQRLLGLQQATMAAEMVGKAVTARAPDGTETSGTVTGVRFTAAGPLLQLGAQEVPLEAITAFTATPATAG